MSDIEVKVTNLEKKENLLKLLVKVLEWPFKVEPDAIDSLPNIRYYAKSLCSTIPAASQTYRSRSQTWPLTLEVLIKFGKKLYFLNL